MPIMLRHTFWAVLVILLWSTVNAADNLEVEQSYESPLHNLEDLIVVLRNSSSKDVAYWQLRAYVLGIKRDELFRLVEAYPEASENIFWSRAFHVLANANKEQILEIEELCDIKDLRDTIDWGNNQLKWLYGPLYCYEEKVVNVSCITWFLRLL